MARSVVKPRGNASSALRVGKIPLLLIVAGVVLTACAIFWMRSSKDAPAANLQPSRAMENKPAPAMAKKLSYEVVNSYPHDPNAFTQGLLWHDGFLYESTGQYGHSSLRKVDLPTGKVLKQVKVAEAYFAEGLALANNRLIQLTWQSKRGFVYDLDNFNLVKEFSYNTEGWGLTFDGKNLILSDGSSALTFLDPETFKPVRKLSVTMNSRPIDQLNELEYIAGEIWANVWQTDQILRIDPETGQVKSYLDMKGLLPEQTRQGGEDVLNGIAYDAGQKRIFVSGKLWPKVFEIKIREN